MSYYSLFLAISFHLQLLYVFFSVLEVISIFESLVVLNIENHTVELTGLAYIANSLTIVCPELSRAKNNVTQ